MADLRYQGAAPPKPDRFAVLLPAYNAMAYIAEQVATILDQKDVSVSLYVSVDRSSDDTFEWVRALARDDERVHVLAPRQSPATGASANVYRLFREVDFTDFDFVSLADQDDVWMLDHLSRAAALLRERTASGYSSDVLAFGKMDARSGWERPGRRPTGITYSVRRARAAHSCSLVPSQKSSVMRLTRDRRASERSQCTTGSSTLSCGRADSPG